MQIATAVQRGSWVYVYDSNRRQLTTLFTGGGFRDGLMGYTSSTVSIRRGDWIYVYDPRGRQLSTTPAR